VSHRGVRIGPRNRGAADPQARRDAISLACHLADRFPPRQRALDAAGAVKINGEEAWMVGPYKVGVRGDEAFVEEPS
jgi:hypothetical protein